MPYETLPARLRNIIPSEHGQSMFRQVVNSQLERGKSESVAFASAWAALERAGYAKDDEGMWVRKMQPTMSQVHTQDAEWDDDDDDDDWDEDDELAKAETYTPPVAARNAAKRVLAWKEKYGDDVKGMTPVGWARARQLASGKPVSRRTVARMSAFARHRQNAKVDPKFKSEPWRDRGYVAWLGWGSDAGIRWANRIMRKVTKARGAEPIYMYRPVMNAEQIIAWAASQGFETTLPADDMHVTVVFSRAAFSAEMSRIADEHGTVHGDNIVVRGGKRTVTSLGDKGAVVLKIESADLQSEHAYFRSLGASWDYQEYTPHVSITYNGRGMDTSKVAPFMGDIVLGPLYAKPLKSEWDTEIVEVRVAKREMNDDAFTTPAEAVARSMDLGLNGEIHVWQTADGQMVYMPGKDHDDYLEAMAEAAGIETDDDDEADSEDAGEGLLERTVTAIMQAAMSYEMNKAYAILKADDEQRIVWGWASVATENGKTVVDLQGDTMTPDEMVKMANRFMESVRTAKAMHEGESIGEVIHSLPLTKELAKALGIETEREGWVIGMKIKDDAMWKSVRAGEFSGFSIGGRAAKREVVQ